MTTLGGLRFDRAWRVFFVSVASRWWEEEDDSESEMVEVVGPGLLVRILGSAGEELELRRLGDMDEAFLGSFLRVRRWVGRDSSTGAASLGLTERGGDKDGHTRRERDTTHTHTYTHTHTRVDDQVR